MAENNMNIKDIIKKQSLLHYDMALHLQNQLSNMSKSNEENFNEIRKKFNFIETQLNSLEKKIILISQKK